MSDPTLKQQVTDAITSLVAHEGSVSEWVNGDTSASYTTLDGTPVPSIQKFIADSFNYAGEYTASTAYTLGQTFRGAASVNDANAYRMFRVTTAFNSGSDALVSSGVDGKYEVLFDLSVVHNAISTTEQAKNDAVAAKVTAEQAKNDAVAAKVATEQAENNAIAAANSIDMGPVITPIVNNVGVLNTYKGAKAAYGLRSLNGSEDTKVVNVRRASDNSQKDFTVKEITSGALTNWVNSSTELPADSLSMDFDYNLKYQKFSSTTLNIDVPDFDINTSKGEISFSFIFNDKHVGWFTLLDISGLFNVKMYPWSGSMQLYHNDAIKYENDFFARGAINEFKIKLHGEGVIEVINNGKSAGSYKAKDTPLLSHHALTFHLWSGFIKDLIIDIDDDDYYFPGHGETSTDAWTSTSGALTGTITGTNELSSPTFIGVAHSLRDLSKSRFPTTSVGDSVFKKFYLSGATGSFADLNDTLFTFCGKSHGKNSYNVKGNLFKYDGRQWSLYHRDTSATYLSNPTEYNYPWEADWAPTSDLSSLEFHNEKTDNWVVQLRRDSDNEVRSFNALEVNSEDVKNWRSSEKEVFPLSFNPLLTEPNDKSRLSAQLKTPLSLRAKWRVKFNVKYNSYNYGYLMSLGGTSGSLGLYLAPGTPGNLSFSERHAGGWVVSPGTELRLAEPLPDTIYTIEIAYGGDTDLTSITYTNRNTGETDTRTSSVPVYAVNTGMVTTIEIGGTSHAYNDSINDALIWNVQFDSGNTGVFDQEYKLYDQKLVDATTTFPDELNRFDGTVYGNPVSILETGEYGKDIAVIDFDGVDDYVDLNHSVVPATGDFDISISYKHDFTGELRYILSQGSAAESFFGYQQGPGGNVIVYTNGTNSSLLTSAILVVGTTYELKTTRVGDTFTFFIDDVEIDTITISNHIIPTDTNTFIGQATWTAGRWVVGSVYDLKKDGVVYYQGHGHKNEDWTNLFDESSYPAEIVNYSLENIDNQLSVINPDQLNSKNYVHFSNPYDNYYNCGSVTIPLRSAWECAVDMTMLSWGAVGDHILPFGTNDWTGGFGLILYSDKTLRIFSKGYHDVTVNVESNITLGTPFTVSYGTTYNHGRFFVKINDEVVLNQSLVQGVGEAALTDILKLGGGSNLTSANNPFRINSAYLFINDILHREYRNIEANTTLKDYSPEGIDATLVGVPSEVYDVSHESNNNTVSYVSRWYDQSRNNNNLSNIAPKQPYLIYSADDSLPAVKTIDGSRYLKYDSDVDFVKGTDINVVAKLAEGDINAPHRSLIGSSQNWSTNFTFGAVGNVWGYALSGSIGANVNVPLYDRISRTAWSYIWDTYTFIHHNGERLVTSDPSTVSSQPLQEVGTTNRIGSNYLLNDKSSWEVSEIIICYNNARKVHNYHLKIETNMGEYYNLDFKEGENASGDMVDGFVTTWYDQSGNGNHATQNTATAQPKIVSDGILETHNDIPTIRYSLADHTRLFLPIKMVDTGNFLITTVASLSALNADSNGILANQGITSALDGGLQLKRYNENLTLMYRDNGVGESIVSNTPLGADELFVSVFWTNSNADKVLFSVNHETPVEADLTVPLTYFRDDNLWLGGGDSNTRWLDGTVSELILYDVNKNSQYHEIESNIMNTYSIDYDHTARLI